MGRREGSSTSSSTSFNTKNWEGGRGVLVLGPSLEVFVDVNLILNSTMCFFFRGGEGNFSSSSKSTSSPNIGPGLDMILNVSLAGM